MPFLPGAAGAARAVLQRLGVARQLDMDDQREVGQVDAARGDVGRDQHPGAAVAQRLQRLVALVLAVLARQATALKPRSVRLEWSRRTLSRVAQNSSADLRLVQPEQVDHGMLDVGRRDGHRLIGDVAMAALLADRRDAQRVALVALGQRDDRPRHGRREEQGAPLRRGRVEDLLEILAKAHVEHLVGLVEHRDLELGEVERAALEMVAQPPRRADDDMGAVREAAALLRRDPCRRRRWRSARPALP